MSQGRTPGRREPLFCASKGVLSVGPVLPPDMGFEAESPDAYGRPSGSERCAGPGPPTRWLLELSPLEPSDPQRHQSIRSFQVKGDLRLARRALQDEPFAAVEVRPAPRAGGLERGHALW